MARQIESYINNKSRVLVLFSLIAMTFGCAPGSQTTRDIIVIGNALGIRAPYENAKFFEDNPEKIFSGLIKELNNRAAQLLVADKNSGIISWGEPGSTFVAIPTQINNLRTSNNSRIAPNLPMWHGVVYCTARIRRFSNGTWLYLHAVGREIKSENAVFSDGTYEKILFREVAMNLDRGSAELQEVTDVTSQDNSNSGETGQTPTTYLREFSTFFRNIPYIKNSEIREKGSSKLYPVPLEEFWAACLDVISQYDVIVRISLTDRIIVFAQGIAVPTEASSEKKIQYVDVILTLYAEPRGKEGTHVYISLLSQHGLAVKGIPDISKKNENGIIAEYKENPKELAAALVMDQLLGQLATQLFYKDRLIEKLTVRLPVKGESQ